jgi:hypothetical protein
MYIALAQRATQIQDESQEDCHSEQRRFESSAKRCKLAPLGAASASASASFAELVAFLGLLVLKIKYI